MIIMVNDVGIARSRNLYAQIEYAPLSDSKTLTQTPLKAVVVQQLPVVKRPYIQVTLDYLVPTTVYRARVMLFRLDGSSYTPLYSTSSYYTTTSGQDPKSLVRTKMLLKGLKEFSDSEHGQVGVNGTVNVDGTRYGATPGEKWCSEFYAWLGAGSLNGIAGISNVPGLIRYFSQHGGVMHPFDIAEKARRGDYLSMDTNGDGMANHSGMFLAYEVEDGGSAFVWTLEGNSGNKVKVHRRPFDNVIMEIGHIMNSQF